MGILEWMIIYIVGYFASLSVMFLGNKKFDDDYYHTPLSVALGLSILSWVMFLIYSIVLGITLLKFPSLERAWKELETKFEQKRK